MSGGGGSRIDMVRWRERFSCSGKSTANKGPVQFVALFATRVMDTHRSRFCVRFGFRTRLVVVACFGHLQGETHLEVCPTRRRNRSDREGPRRSRSSGGPGLMGIG